jgi:hypothetical protein
MKNVKIELEYAMKPNKSAWEAGFPPMFVICLIELIKKPILI